MDIQQYKQTIIDMHNGNMNTLTEQLKLHEKVMCGILGDISKEMQRYKEDIGEEMKIKLPEPDPLIKNWVNGNEIHPPVTKSLTSTTQDTFVAPTGTQSLNKTTSTANPHKKVDGTLTMDISDINIHMEEPRVPEKDKDDSSTYGESTLLCMNSQFHTRSVGVTADLFTGKTAQPPQSIDLEEEDGDDAVEIIKRKPHKKTNTVAKQKENAKPQPRKQKKPKSLAPSPARSPMSMKAGTYMDEIVISPSFPSQSFKPTD